MRLSQREVAERISADGHQVSGANLARVERRERNLTLALTVAWCAALHISVGDMLG